MASNSVVVTTTFILIVFVLGVLFKVRSVYADKEVTNYSFIPIYLIFFLLIISNYTIGTNMVMDSDTDDDTTPDSQIEIEKRINN